MGATMRGTDVGARLAAVGARALAGIDARSVCADALSRLAPRTRMLCAGLGLLGGDAYEALGGRTRREEVERAGALLSLLTKVDDQVLDDPAFHAGRPDHPEAMRARAWAWLEPTLEAIRVPARARPEPRCRLAADLGETLRLLALPARLEPYLVLVARAWRAQADALAIVRAKPGAVGREEVCEAARAVCGGWLQIMVGLAGLPAEARRDLTDGESGAVREWGLRLQWADDLADLEKDVREGNAGGVVGRTAWERAARAWEEAVAGPDVPRAYRIVRDQGVDRDGLPSRAEGARLRTALRDLGAVAETLSWVHGSLLERYLAHPCCARAAADLVGFHPHAQGNSLEEGAPCSEP